MNRDIKILVSVIAVLILLVALAIDINLQRKDTMPSSSKILGLVVTVTEDSWKDELERSIEDAAARYDMAVMPLLAERNQNAQIDALRALIAYQADVIVFSPLVENGWDKVLSEANRAGIPIIAVDKAVRSGRGGITASYVGYDYYTAAGKAADAMLESIKGDKTIVELCGTTGAYPVREITRGFRETLEKDGRYRINYSVCGEYMRSKGKEIVKGLLRNNYKIDILISHNDAMTLGAIDAIEQEGKVPGEDIKIYAFGGDEEVVSLVKEGKIEYLAACDPLLGDTVMETAAALMAGGADAEDALRLVKTNVITKGALAQ
ncbi:MAG: sugar transporter substrate-binding protein [Bacillota bacterium]|jgi:simple sugar transport system substrate-binding protein|nr:sugar transporter substrate-binding protein [Bacillota bacterium]